MSKEVFNIDFRKGSFIEKYSNAVGTNVGNKITKQEKGLVYAARQSNSGQITYSAADTTALNFGTNSFSMICAVRIRGYVPIGSSYNMVFGKGQLSSSGSILLGYTSNNMLDYEWQDGTGGFQNITFNNYGDASDGKFHLVILTFDGTIYKAYIDNVQESTTSTDVKSLNTSEDFKIGSDKINSRRSNSDILYIRAYEGTLSQQERNKLYEEFLRSSPTEKPISGFEYPKPTDLSSEEGLIVAHNMIPSAGGILVDISGNGNNALITEAPSTKNGLQSKGHGSNSMIEYDHYLFGLDTVWSFQTRIKNYKGGATFDNFIGSTHSERNIWLRTSNKIAFRSGTGNYYHFTELYSDIENKEVDLQFVSDGTNVSLYIDGVLNSTVIPDSTEIYFDRILRGYSNNNFTPELEILDFRAHNRTLTTEEAKRYHNSFVHTVINEDFQNNAVGDTL